jgi:hypothetical protein
MDTYQRACVARGWSARACEPGARLVDLGGGRWLLEARALAEADEEFAYNPPGTRLASYLVEGCATEGDALAALGVTP